MVISQLLLRPWSFELRDVAMEYFIMPNISVLRKRAADRVTKVLALSQLRWQRRKSFRIWSGLSESNRHLNLGKVRFSHLKDAGTAALIESLMTPNWEIMENNNSSSESVSEAWEAGNKNLKTLELVLWEAPLLSPPNPRNVSGTLREAKQECPQPSFQSRIRSAENPQSRDV